MRPIANPPAVIAHRGASAHAPENTLVACALAVLQGADALEIDLRATRDGELVLLHDETLLRTAGDVRAIADITSDELRAIDDAVRPVTLAELLDCFRDGTDYLIDVKRIPPVCERDLIDAITTRGLSGRVTIQSFDHLLLRRLRLRAPGLSVAALLPVRADVRLTLDVVAPFVSGIGPCAAVTDGPLVDAAHRRGLVVRTWTVNEGAEMERLVDLGVDALITDMPGRARALIGAGGPSAATNDPAAAARTA